MLSIFVKNRYNSFKNIQFVLFSLNTKKFNLISFFKFNKQFFFNKSNLFSLNLISDLIYIKLVILSLFFQIKFGILMFRSLASKQFSSFFSSSNSFFLSNIINTLKVFDVYSNNFKFTFSRLYTSNYYNIFKIIIKDSFVFLNYFSIRNLNLLNLRDIYVLKNNLKKYLQGFVYKKRYINLLISYQYIIECSKFLKNTSLFLFNSLLDILVIDYPSRLRRFELMYSFVSIVYSQRIFVKTFITDTTAMKSLTSLFKSADWLERECWDLFGVFFINHPNLRRILTDYGFHGHPMRKDFPLTGYIEVRFDDERYSVIYEPLEMTQEFRTFNFKSPWEKYIV